MKTLIIMSITALYMFAALAVAGEGATVLRTAKAAVTQAETGYQLIK